MDAVLACALVPQAVNPSIGITMGRIANVICSAQVEFPELNLVSDRNNALDTYTVKNDSIFCKKT